MYPLLWPVSYWHDVLENGSQRGEGEEPPLRLPILLVLEVSRYTTREKPSTLLNSTTRSNVDLSRAQIV